MKQKTRMWLMILLCLMFLFSTANLLRQYLHQKKMEADWQTAQALTVQPAETTLPTEPSTEAATEPVTEPTTVPTESPETVWVPEPVWDEHMEELAAKDMESLRQVNPDVVGWIWIPDTPIDYPLLQGEDNEYYLEHTWKGEPSVYGSILLECENAADLSEFHTIIYGHNMRDNSMFGSLNEFESPQHYEHHPYLYLLTDGGVLRYEIYSSYLAEVTGLTYGIGFEGESLRAEFLQLTLEKNLLATDVEPAVTDRILTLSTCTGMGYAQRRVLHARLPMIEIIKE